MIFYGDRFDVWRAGLRCLCLDPVYWFLFRVWYSFLLCVLFFLFTSCNWPLDVFHSPLSTQSIPQADCLARLVFVGSTYPFFLFLCLVRIKKGPVIKSLKTLKFYQKKKRLLCPEIGFVLYRDEYLLWGHANSTWVASTENLSAYRVMHNSSRHQDGRDRQNSTVEI